MTGFIKSIWRGERGWPLYILFGLIISFFVVSNLAYAQSEDENWKKLQEFEKVERLSNGAAIELYWKLKEQYGYKLRKTGLFLFCGYPKKATEMRPKEYELALEAGELIDKLDISRYGYSTYSERMRLEFIRRAITAVTVHIEESVVMYETMAKLDATLKNKMCSNLENLK